LHLPSDLYLLVSTAFSSDSTAREHKLGLKFLTLLTFLGSVAVLTSSFYSLSLPSFLTAIDGDHLSLAVSVSVVTSMLEMLAASSYNKYLQLV
jgi:hypothetical protein